MEIRCRRRARVRFLEAHVTEKQVDLLAQFPGAAAQRGEKRAVRQIRLSAQEAIEEDDTESLREDVLEAFTEDQVEEIERRLDNGDFYEFLTDVLDEWSGDDVDELLELLETQLGEVGIDLKTDTKTAEGDEGGAAAASDSLMDYIESFTRSTVDGA